MRVDRSLKAALIAAVAVALATPALAQGAGMGGGMGGMGGGGKHGGHGQDKAKTEDSGKKKVDEKAYKSAIERLPDKPYDAWKNVRGQ
jgi:Spy/CpxP family protein refolding chaperone